MLDIVYICVKIIGYIIMGLYMAVPMPTQAIDVTDIDGVGESWHCLEVEERCGRPSHQTNVNVCSSIDVGFDGWPPG